jgi:hypothetical protein
VGVKPSRVSSDEAGFVLVDTLTAVMVISLVLTVCLLTVRTAGSSIQSARTAGQARVLLSSLMESTPRVSGAYQGISGNLIYRVNVTDTELNNVHLCQFEAEVRQKSKGRIYRLSGTRWCARTAL